MSPQDLDVFKQYIELLAAISDTENNDDDV